MDASPDLRWRPLQDALEVWAHAIEAVEDQAYPVKAGGHFDPVMNASLLDAVEPARLRYKQLSLSIQQAHLDLR